jgi:hypothetical protein
MHIVARVANKRLKKSVAVLHHWHAGMLSNFYEFPRLPKNFPEIQFWRSP